MSSRGILSVLMSGTGMWVCARGLLLNIPIVKQDTYKLYGLCIFLEF